MPLGHPQKCWSFGLVALFDLKWNWSADEFVQLLQNTTPSDMLQLLLGAIEFIILQIGQNFATDAVRKAAVQSIGIAVPRYRFVCVGLIGYLLIFARHDEQKDTIRA